MAIKTSKNAENRFAAYKSSNRQATNRKAKLERQLKLNPTNVEQLELALKNIYYRRRIPKAATWSHQMIRTASLFKQFTGKFDKLFFSTDLETSHTAAKARNPNKFNRLGPKGVVVSRLPQAPKGSMFALGLRIE